MRKKEKEVVQKTEEEVPLQDVLSSLTDYLNDEGDFSIPPIWYLDSGNYSLNYILSGKLSGGWPSSQVCEVFGDPSTGKTLIMMKAIASMQKMGGIALVQDVERRWDWDFAKFHGVDVESTLKDAPETVEDWCVRTDKILTELLKRDPIPKILICTDSVASMSTNWEMENVGTKEDQGKKAKRIKAAMRVIPKKIAKAGAILLCSNHLISDPRITYGSNLITPGGKGITFQSTVRIEMAKPHFIAREGKNRPIGAILRLKCTKNSITPPFGETELSVMWASGINPYSGLLDMMVDLDIIKSSGGWYSFNELKFRSGDVEQFITEHPEVMIDPLWEKNYFTGGLQ